MFELQLTGGMINPAPREFKSKDEAMKVFSVLKGKGAPAILSKKVGNKTEIVAVTAGFN